MFPIVFVNPGAQNIGTNIGMKQFVEKVADKTIIPANPDPLNSPRNTLTHFSKCCMARMSCQSGHIILLAAR